MVLCWRAGLVLAAAGEAIEDGWVAFEEGRVVEVGDGEAPATPQVDRPDAVLAPAFVNAHVHLELTHLGGLLPEGVGLAEWLGCLVPLRRRLRGRFGASVRAGLRRCIQGGFGVLGEIEAAGASWRPALGSGIAGVAFQEVIGQDDGARGDPVSRPAAALGSRPSNASWRAGISPHAPYTVGRGLLAALGSLADARSVPLSVHAAEDPAEEEFLRRGTGPLGDFLAGVGALPPDWSPPGAGSIEILDRAGCLSARTLIAHANYPADGDVDRLAASGCTVAYCPGSHAFFRHAPYPLEDYLAAGIPVALGTDSLASNHELSALEEMRRVREIHPGVGADEVFRMATETGARALGRGSGRLEEGQPMDAVWLDRAGDGDPWESVTLGHWPLLATATDGVVVGPGRGLA